MTKTDETTDPDEAVAAADEEAQAAEELVSALEERVRDGDESVSHEQIEQQRSLSKWARLRAEAARRKAEKARAAALERQQDAARAEARRVLAGHTVEDLAQAHVAAFKALCAMADACTARNDAIREAADILSCGHVAGGTAEVGFAHGTIQPRQAVHDLIRHLHYQHPGGPTGHGQFYGLIESGGSPSPVYKAAAALLAEEDN